jgi:hypothetical protein
MTAEERAVKIVELYHLGKQLDGGNVFFNEEFLVEHIKQAEERAIRNYQLCLYKRAPKSNPEEISAKDEAINLEETLDGRYDPERLELILLFLQRAEERGASKALAQDLQRRMAAGCALTLERYKVIRERVAMYNKMKGNARIWKAGELQGECLDAMQDREEIIAYCEYLELQLQYLAEDRPDAQRLKDLGYNAGLEEAAKMLENDRYWEKGRPTRQTRVTMAATLRGCKVEVK